MFKDRLALAWISAWFCLMLSLLGCNDSEFDNLRTIDEIPIFEFFDEPRSSVWSLLEDNDGNIWIGTDNNGVFTYDGEQFTNITNSDGLVSNTVYTLTQDNSDAIWLGTQDGISIIDDEQLFFIPALAGVAVSGIIEDEDGTIWIGTFDFGILFIQNGEINQVLDDNCNSCNTINTMFMDSEGIIWFGTSGGLKELRNNTLTLYTTQNGLSGNQITSIYEDQWGSYWVGSVDGTAITRFDGTNDFEEVSLLNSESQNFITSSTEDRFGNLLIGTVGNGLVAYDGLVMYKFFEANLDRTILSLITDRNGDVWVGMNDGTLAKYTGESRL